MPTIYRQDGFEVMIYTNDHRPAHVHIFKAEAQECAPISAWGVLMNGERSSLSRRMMTPFG